MSKDISLIDEISSRVDIVDVVSKYVPLKRSGTNFSGCCPFHHEKTPSFIVSPQKQIFKCFGCGVGGNMFTFIQEIEKVDFWDAVKLLADQNHIDISAYQTSSKYTQRLQDEKEKMKRIHTLAQDFFTEGLKKNPTALQYLKEKRKLNDEIISDFGIGYAPDKSYELLQYLRSKGFTDDDLVQASLAKRNANSPEAYAFFRHRIMFPIYDLMKNVIGFTARVLNPDDQPKYLNSAEHKAFEKSKILYGLSHAKPHLNQFQKLIIVEGQMDVIGLHRLGFPIGIATSGTSITEDHIKIIKRYTQHLFFLFDNDQAGQQATFRAMKLCYHQDLFPKIITLPEHVKDIDDVANLEQGKQIFETCLAQAQDGFLVIFERLRNASDMTSPIDKQKLINAMFELIIAVSNLTIQEHYKMLLAEKLGFAPEIINVQFKTYKAGEGKLFLRQQERQEEFNKAAPYQPSRELLFASLFYQEFLGKLRKSGNDTTETGTTAIQMQDEEFLQALTQFAMQVAVAVPESEIAKVFTGTLTEQEKEEIHTLQLRREKELGEVNEQTTKKAVIQRVISPHNPGQPSPIMEYFKMASKSHHLSDEEKIQLNKLKNVIGKR